jgi:thymidylate synthase
MKPFEERVKDNQYNKLLIEIVNNGVVIPTQQEVDAVTVMVPTPMHFKIENGFPMITERNMNPKTSDKLPLTIWQQAIAEIIAFINGARTLKELESYGCYWWNSWATPEKCAKRGLQPGDLGSGSYGAAFNDFPTFEGKRWNQFAYIIRQMVERPHLRNISFLWIPIHHPGRVCNRR